ncbi:MAG: transposase [Polaribacter sp.]
MYTVFKQARCFYICVVNALLIKRFTKIKLAKIKTDKCDTKAIYDYGLTQGFAFYIAINDTQSECVQLFRSKDNLLKTRTAIKNNYFKNIQLNCLSIQLIFFVFLIIFSLIKQYQIQN